MGGVNNECTSMYTKVRVCLYMSYYIENVFSFLLEGRGDMGTGALHKGHAPLRNLDM